MNHDPQELRSAAEQEFLKSLKQLQKTLSTDEDSQTPSTMAANRGRTSDRPTDSPLIDEAEMEEAAADIEEFINSHYPTE